MSSWDPCYCWNLRDGCLIIGIWSLIWSLVQLGLFSWQTAAVKFLQDKLQNNKLSSHYPVFNIHNNMFVRDYATPEENVYTAIFIVQILNLISSFAVMCASPFLVYGVQVNSRILIWPWFPCIAASIICSLVYCLLWWIGTVAGYQVGLSVLQFISVIVNIYCLLCVYAYYRRILKGFGEQHVSFKTKQMIYEYKSDGSGSNHCAKDRANLAIAVHETENGYVNETYQPEKQPPCKVSIFASKDDKSISQDQNEKNLPDAYKEIMENHNEKQPMQKFRSEWLTSVIEQAEPLNILLAETDQRHRRHKSIDKEMKDKSSRRQIEESTSPSLIRQRSGSASSCRHHRRHHHHDARKQRRSAEDKDSHVDLKIVRRRSRSAEQSPLPNNDLSDVTSRCGHHSRKRSRERLAAAQSDWTTDADDAKDRTSADARRRHDDVASILKRNMRRVKKEEKIRTLARPSPAGLQRSKTAAPTAPGEPNQADAPFFPSMTKQPDFFAPAGAGILIPQNIVIPPQSDRATPQRFQISSEVTISYDTDASRSRSRSRLSTDRSRASLSTPTSLGSASPAAPVGAEPNRSGETEATLSSTTAQRRRDKIAQSAVGMTFISGNGSTAV